MMTVDATCDFLKIALRLIGKVVSARVSDFFEYLSW